MQTAFDNIKEIYDYEDSKEIVNHGCQSGVCFQHIYYGDTIKFFDNHEDEIIEYIADTLGGDMNEQLWNDNPCHINGYKNQTVWAFIELVAMTTVDEYESTTCEEMDDEPIKLYANYSKEEVASLTKQGFEVVNA